MSVPLSPPWIVYERPPLRRVNYGGLRKVGKGCQWLPVLVLSNEFYGWLFSCLLDRRRFFAHGLLWLMVSSVIRQKLPPQLGRLVCSFLHRTVAVDTRIGLLTWSEFNCPLGVYFCWLLLYRWSILLALLHGMFQGGKAARKKDGQST